MESKNPLVNWRTVERPGYLGKRKEIEYARWNNQYGEGDWRLVWETAKGETWFYGDVFWKIYVPGYTIYFLGHLDEAEYLTKEFSYAYDKDMICRNEAFDPNALYEKTGRPNQFHNVAFNIALEYGLGLSFQGGRLIQVREGKPETSVETWPEGWRWSPGRIATVRPDLIPVSSTPFFKN